MIYYKYVTKQTKHQNSYIIVRITVQSMTALTRTISSVTTFVMLCILFSYSLIYEPL